MDLDVAYLTQCAVQSQYEVYSFYDWIKTNK